MRCTKINQGKRRLKKKRHSNKKGPAKNSGRRNRVFVENSRLKDGEIGDQGKRLQVKTRGVSLPGGTEFGSNYCQQLKGDKNHLIGKELEAPFVS